MTSLSFLSNTPKIIDLACRNPGPRQIQSIVDRALAGTVKKLLFISSTGVYSNDNQIVTEQSIPSPTTNSGKALVSIEKKLQSIPGFNLQCFTYNSSFPFYQLSYRGIISV